MGAITRETTVGTLECQGGYIKDTYTGKDVEGLGDVFPWNFEDNNQCFGGAYAYFGQITGTNQLFVISAVNLTDDQSSLGCVFMNFYITLVLATLKRGVIEMTTSKLTGTIYRLLDTASMNCVMPVPAPLLVSLMTVCLSCIIEIGALLFLHYGYQP